MSCQSIAAKRGFSEAIFCAHVQDVMELEAVEILRGIEQTVRVVNAKAGDFVVGEEAQQQPVRGEEDYSCCMLRAARSLMSKKRR